MSGLEQAKQRPPEPEVPVPVPVLDQFPAQRGNSSDVHVIVARRPSDRSLAEAYLLWFPLGLLGTHHFYLRNYGFGFLYLFTGGLAGVGWIVDGFRMRKLVVDSNEKIRQGPDYKEKIDLVDAYLMWFPFGLLGCHHFYMRRGPWGVAYVFTLGLLGIGWLIDAFRMPSLVREANEKLEEDRLHDNDPKQVSLCDAYVLGISPAGIFGAHHFYVGRPDFGCLYLFSAGLVGVGWIVDWFRMKWIVERANNPTKQPLGRQHKYVDEAYLMAFPFGFLGIHHFYLERPTWGLVYFFTGGLLGIGWIVDFIRMPCLVAEANKRLMDEQVVAHVIRGQMGPGYSAATGPAGFTSPAYPGYNPGVVDVSSSAATTVNPVPTLQPPPYSAAAPIYPATLLDSDHEQKQTEK